jgi:hypothetical protein
MRHPSRLLFAFFCCLIAAPLWGQAPQYPVYVSGGPYIYNVQNGSLVKVYDATIGGPSITGSAYDGPYFSSISIGPDNVDGDNTNGNAVYPFLIYACDDKTDTIIRFAPGGAVSTQNPASQLVAKTGFRPVCGRATSTGDFYVTDESGGSGTTVYEFSGIANVSFPNGGISAPSPVALSSDSGVANAGITQKNIGDLLLVDTADNEVLRSTYAIPFSTASPYITTNLNKPVGITRISTGDVFVSNGGLLATISHFTGDLAASTCSTLPLPAATNRLGFVAASETDTIYVVSSTTTPDGTEDLDYESEPNSPPAAVWSWTPPPPNTPNPSCALTFVANSPTLLSGVAVAPISTNTITVANVTANTTTPFDFNSSEFQVTPTGSCSPDVTAYPLSLVDIDSMIQSAVGTLPNGATPVVNLGEGGYEIAYIADGGCTAAADAIFGFYDPSSVTNPRIIQCDPDPNNPSPESFLDGNQKCVALTTIGDYPIGGPLTADPGTVGRGGGTGSVYVLVNANPASPDQGGTPGSFCGFYPPISSGSNPAVTLDTDDFLPITFQLAQSGGNCRTGGSGGFVNNAQALLSVAQVVDANGKATFVPMLNLKTVFNLGTTFPQPGLCKYFPKSPLACTYALILNLQGSGLTAGTYDVSILFETGNTSPQSFTLTVLKEGSPGTF